jgi:GNAT superfamily N-acetyltransferase
VREPPAVSLRPATAEDEQFLYALYVGTREDELAPLGWDAKAREQFLRMQFATRSSAHDEAHPAASQQLVLIDGRPAGRLYVERRSEEIHVIDIALLPEHRGSGVGAALLQGLIDEARNTRLRVVLEALRGSRAVSLYRRLGFRLEHDGEVYVRLTWSA